MPRSASTAERTDSIYAKLISSNAFAEMVVERHDGTDWVPIADLDEAAGVSIRKDTKIEKFARFSMTPRTSTLSFSVINRRGKYSEGSGDELEGVLDLDTKIRIRGGYRLDTGEGEDTTSLDLAGSQNRYFFTKEDSGSIVIDSLNSVGQALKYFPNWFTPLYDSTTYDSDTYSKDAYFVAVFDNEDYADVSQIDITATGTAGVVYYRFSNSLAGETSSSWTNAGNLVNGTKTITVVPPPKPYRYLLVGIVWDGISWSLAETITDITITHNKYIEWIYRDIFYMDTPSFTDPKAPAIPTVNCTARDIWKRAIETEINLQDISGGGGTAMDDLVKLVADQAGIRYTASSIADLSAFTNRTLSTGLGDVEKVDTIYTLIMSILNQTGFAYRMYLEYDEVEDENVLFVQPVPSTYVTDFVFNYRYYESIGNKRKNYNHLLRRLTVISDDQVPNAEVQLGTANYTTTGTKTISWAGNAEHKRYTVVVNTGDAVVTLVSVEPTQLQFSITGTTIDVDITVYGCKWSSDPTFEGEWIDHDNMVSNAGIVSRLTNPLAVSDAECRDIGKGHVEIFGDPSNEANNIRYPYLNLMLLQNDMVLLWTQYIYVDDLYFITGVEYFWNRSRKPSQSTVFNLEDSGLNFTDLGDYIYDRDQAPVSGLIMNYDIGYVYDMADGPGATAAEIDANTTIVHNTAIV